MRKSMATRLRYQKGYQFFDSNGNPLALANLYYYQAGTTTLQTTYSEFGGHDYEYESHHPRWLWTPSGRCLSRLDEQLQGSPDDFSYNGFALAG